MPLIQCPDCGQSVSDKAKTCIHCGCPLGNTAAPAPVESVQPTSVPAVTTTPAVFAEEQEVTKEYLFFLKAVESLIPMQKTELENLKAKESDLQKELEQPVPKPIERMPTVTVHDIISKKKWRKVTTIAFCVCVLFALIYKLIIMEDSPFMGWFGLILFASGALIALLMLLVTEKDIREMEEKNREESQANKTIYEAELRQYEIDCVKDQERKKELPALIEECRKEITEKENDIAASEKQLASLYSLNLIPIQYRNIYAIYYLYDYLSSSNESLTNALLHFNLDEMKQSLDGIIQTTGALVIQQARNEDHLKKITALTEHSVQQNAVIAACTETSLMLQTANIIFN